MNTDEAIKIIEAATEPQNQGRITREGYWQIQEAINAIKASYAPVPPDPAPKPE